MNMTHTRISPDLFDKDPLRPVLEAVPLALFLVNRLLESDGSMEEGRHFSDALKRL
jgi:hypothetical protein